MQHLQFPIGRFEKKEQYTEEEIAGYIQSIEVLPERLTQLIQEHPTDLLNKPYREGGWTALQVVHHIADSHLNSYLRMKLAITESHPTIKSYDEQAWALLQDYQADASVSLALIKALHQRWVIFLKTLQKEDMGKTFFNPESEITYTLSESIAQYAWHGEHHYAHIVIALKS